MMECRERRAYDTVKRLLDALAACVALLLLSPLLAAIGIVVLANFGSPILFTQDRPGKKGKVFRLYKFRSMVTFDLESELISDEDRLTRFGCFLRSTSLDELPSLVNVVKGDMSFVGPRPLLVRYLDRYTADQARRHEVRPGVTGLAQVTGRNSISWQEKFELDVIYVDKRSFSLDAKILVRTLASVVRREGIAAEGTATMPEFDQDPSNGDI